MQGNINTAAQDESQPKVILGDLNLNEIVTLAGRFRVSEKIARRIFCRIQRHGDRTLCAIKGLAPGQIESLHGLCTWPKIDVVERREAADGFVKYLFRLHDGHLVEAVRIPLPDPAAARALKEERKAGRAQGLQPLPVAKHTLCISSQVGCALACDFCETGRMGAIRNLATWEILAQYQHIARESEHPIRGIVFMGMGEPLLNYRNVIKAARIFSEPSGPAIAAPNITISTAGIVPMIRRFTDERQPFRLVFSLGAPNEELRRRLMPVEKRWSLDELVAAICHHAEATRGRVTIAYVGCGGLNMSPQHAQQLVDRFKGVRIRLNLIPVTDPSGQYHPPSEEEIGAFFDVLGQAGVPVVRRYSGGGEIAAACGNLAASQRGGRVLPVLQ